MRIAIVINTSWNIYNFRKGLIKFFLKQGHSVIAIAPKDDYSTKLVELGCEYLPISMENKGTNPFNDLKLILELKKVYSESKADIFLQFTIKPNIYGTLAAKMLGKPTICNVSGLGTIFINPKKISSKIGTFLYKIAFKYPKKVFFQNQDDEKLFLENNLVHKNITDVLPGSGIDLKYFQNKNEFKRNNPFVFLMISRLLIDKGVEEFVNAAQIILKNNNNVSFKILGKFDGSKGSISNEKLNFWLNKGFISHLGESENVKEIIEQADCIVLPSYREGTPRTLLEAMALKKPIVTTNVPGCKETVINEKNGYLCEVKSEIDLAEKLNKILNLPENELEQFGNESRKIVEQTFDETIVIDKYKDAINAIFRT